MDARDVIADERLWQRVGAGLGLGRVALGIVFWKAPVLSVRVAGLDHATSVSADWLARMTAARDVAIGAGTAVAALRTGGTPVERAAWYLAGAIADGGDTLAIRRGRREGRLAALPALAASTSAAGTVVVGLVAAAREIAAARALPRGHATYSPAD